jgi:hypothetical protein
MRVRATFSLGCLATVGCFNYLPRTNPVPVSSEVVRMRYAAPESLTVHRRDSTWTMPGVRVVYGRVVRAVGDTVDMLVVTVDQWESRRIMPSDTRTTLVASPGHPIESYGLDRPVTKRIVVTAAAVTLLLGVLGLIWYSGASSGRVYQ